MAMILFKEKEQIVAPKQKFLSNINYELVRENNKRILIKIVIILGCFDLHI